MAKQTINQGTAPTGAGGDTFRTGSAKLQANDNEIYTALGANASGVLPSALPIAKGGTGATTVAAARTNLGLGDAASKTVGTQDGNVMEVGAFGLGSVGSGTPIGESTVGAEKNSFCSLDRALGNGLPNVGYSFTGFFRKSSAGGTALALPYPHPSSINLMGYHFVSFSVTDGTVVQVATIYTNKNTNKGTNGVLSEKSPVTHLYHDRVEHTGNEKELQPIEFIKQGIGDYLLKNTTGLAQEGWYIVIPHDANGNPLIAVEYDDRDGDIHVRTYKRKFDYEQAKVVADHDNPMDIPETRWIDLRFNDDPSMYKDEVTDEHEQ